MGVVLLYDAVRSFSCPLCCCGMLAKDLAERRSSGGLGIGMGWLCFEFELKVVPSAREREGYAVCMRMFTCAMASLCERLCINSSRVCAEHIHFGTYSVPHIHTRVRTDLGHRRG